MDEPTSALTEKEKENLFKIIKELKNSGVAIIYISHRLSEVFEISDRVTVLRDGNHVATKPTEQLTRTALVKMMVGREIGEISRRSSLPTTRDVLRITNLGKTGVFEGISLCIHEGEILSLGGLMGAGRTELAKCIFGLDQPDSGEILIAGKSVHIDSPLKAIRLGICYVPEDRRLEGFIPLKSITYNLSLPSLDAISQVGWIKGAREEDLASEYMQRLAIKTPSAEQRVMNLSGGNQQKVVLGKWLARHPRLLILDEPTRGIDVGSKAEIHAIIEDLARQGLAILLISSELPELLGVSDRVIVLREGQIAGEFSREDATQESIMKAATGAQ